MSDKLTELLDLLELEQIDQSIFVLATQPVEQTLVWWQIMAQALMAAQRRWSQSAVFILCMATFCDQERRKCGNNPC